jgi:antitoxin component of RelBE/YafQ-DinJ toxin-antitoxin module
MTMLKMFDAPIPGENFTSDTRNYPWHRPPEITEYDDGVDYLIEKLSEQEQAELTYSKLEIGLPITTVVSSLLMQGISKGKFPIDLAVLMAGPLARYIEIVAKKNEIKYEMGIEQKNRQPITPTSLKMALGILEDDDDDEADEVEIEENPEGAMGFMAPPMEGDEPASDEEQAAMLGQSEEEDEEEML